VPPGESIDLGERRVDALRVERSAALVERVFVAEVTVLGTPARDDDGVRDEVAAPVDEIATDWRLMLKRAVRGRAVHRGRGSGAKIAEELRKGLVARPEKDGVGVRSGLVGKRRDMQAAEHDE
jgi:hypothetical protein